MGCKVYNDDGTCGKFTKEKHKCPFTEVVRNFFGDMNMCAPVAKAFKEKQYDS